MSTRFSNIEYRTADRQANYVFDFVHVSQSAGWRVYIVDQPPYRGRDEGANASHRIGSRERRYVCWTRPLRTLDEAKSVAAMWADCTQEYIRTGRFQEPAGRPEIKDMTAMAQFGGALGDPTDGSQNKAGMIQRMRRAVSRLAY